MPESASAFSRVDFVTSAGPSGGLPPDDLPEIAFAGRSNVGKSSAINALAKRKRLAFVSKTPGRTQTINFFDLSGRGRLVDLPGYGYARVPQSVRAQWDKLVGGYLGARAALAGVVLLMDARHPFTVHDEHLLAWLRPAGRRLLVLLSKCDKLSRQERAKVLASARAPHPQGRGRGGAALFESIRRGRRRGARAARWMAPSSAAGIKNPRQRGSKPGGKTP